MGTKLKPSNYDCYDNAFPDEPMFILLARDPQAPYLVITWANDREKIIESGGRPHSDIGMVHEAMNCAREMITWRKENWPGRKGNETLAEAKKRLIAHLEVVEGYNEASSVGGLFTQQDRDIITLLRALGEKI